MIRVVLPVHLKKIAQLDGEVEVDVNGPATIAGVLDEIERMFPQLRGTIRDHRTKRRRPYLRYFACGLDLSHEPDDDPLPHAVVEGAEPLRVVGAMSGG